MLEQPKAKLTNFEEVFEDLITLQKKKYRLQSEKKKICKNVDFNRISKTENLFEYTTWDLILMQVKLLALDFFEERKWKKSLLCNLSKQCTSKIKKEKSNTKCNELYKKCLCLYRSLLLNNNFQNIKLGYMTTPKENYDLNNYIKKTVDLDYINNIVIKWKETIKKINYKLEKLLGEKSYKNAKHFIKTITLMEDMIKLHEEKTKLTFESNLAPNKFVNDIEKEQIIIDSKIAIVNIEVISKEMDNLIEELNKEVNNHDILAFIKKVENTEIEFNNSPGNSTEENSANRDYETSNKKRVLESLSQIDNKSEFYGFSPYELFYDNSNLLTEDIQSIKSILDTNIKGKISTIDWSVMDIDSIILPNDSQIDEFSETFNKYFPILYEINGVTDDKSYIY